MEHQGEALRTSIAQAFSEWYGLVGADVVFGEPWVLSPAIEQNGARNNRNGDIGGGLSECRSLDDIRAMLEAFDGCPLKRTAKNLCFCDGNPNARIMLIGEAPGAEEDRLGKPFVGPSGRLLDRMLLSIGLDRTQVWITNLIFWRPPGNRTPTNDEIEACRPFLTRSMELLRPKLVLFVGGAAAKALLGKNEGVMRLRGRRSRYAFGTSDEAECLVTFHPAFALRQPMQKKLIWRDLLTFRSMIEDAGLQPEVVK